MKNILLSSLIGVGLTLFAGSQGLGQAIDIGDATNFSKSLAVAPGGNLTMSVERGGVHIAGADQNTIGIEVQRDVTGASDSDAAKILREEHVVIEKTGSSISINSTEPDSLHSFFGWNQPNLNVHYEITVPRQFDVRVTTGGGGVELDSLRGDLHVRTGGGHIKFEDIDGNVEGETGGGHVYAHNCKSPLQIRTGGDNITIEGFTGPDIQARTGGGSVSADFVAAPTADSAFRTGGGNVRVRLPGNSALNLDARTGSGTVRTDLPVEFEGKLSGDRLKGTINGGGPSLELRTGGGNIEILKVH
ncbi:MAG TPA: DUF4097 family beta strand repeat-containing protein [Candidatus Sulfotelmatobacter sp.]|nr:DUF4097 family beta strand repeat-containing protein [Candidatus Sulfotelmatobacter sp.]